MTLRLKSSTSMLDLVGRREEVDLVLARVVDLDLLADLPGDAVGRRARS